nr:PREDICTED: uncharacterized protein LOC109029841 [Bemisia tabaci]
MDLDDDSVPRGAPKPRSFTEIPNKPEVPEISLIFDSRSPFDKDSVPNTIKPTEQPTEKTSDLAPVSESYNVWRFKNAHLLNHVSSRPNSFQPAPLYDGRSEGRPAFSSNSTVNPPSNFVGLSSGHQMNYGNSASEKIPVRSSSPSENSPYMPNNFQYNSQMNYVKETSENRPICKFSSSGNSSENSNGFHNGYHMSHAHNEAQIDRLKHSSSPSVSPSRNLNNLQNGYQINCVNGIPESKLAFGSVPSENSSRLPNSLQNGCQMNLARMETQVDRLKHNSCSSSSPSSHPNTLQNGYQMNYVQFSSVSAPMPNQNSAVALANGVGNHQNVSMPPHNNKNLNQYGVYNPYEPKDLVVRNSDRKVSFEDLPKDTFHSVSPCKCNTCVQKMHTKMCRLPQQMRQFNPPPVSPAESCEQPKTKRISTSDLYQIVLNQTEQLMLLREKVDELLKEKTPSKAHALSIQQSPQKRTVGIQVNADDDLRHRSVGVMTSFCERNSPSPQPRKTPPKIKDAEKDCCCSCNHKSSPRSSPKDRVSDEDDIGSNRSKKSTPNSSPFSQDKNDVSLTLNAANLPPVLEQIPSPEPSVHVEMQDYHSSSDDESVESVKQNPDNLNHNGKQNGWTFYDNVIGQVNNILQNSQEAALQSQPVPKNPINSIRQATLEQLHKMGIGGVDEKNTCEKRMGQELFPAHFNQIPNQHNLGESDLSLHMNQLAMKYLNKDQFTNAVGIQQDIAVCNMNGGTNLSFTTLRYLERYHLMPAELKQDFPPTMECCPQENFNHPQPRFENHHLHQVPQHLTNKVLDITALKQQPKLL